MGCGWRCCALDMQRAREEDIASDGPKLYTDSLGGEWTKACIKCVIRYSIVLICV